MEILFEVLFTLVVEVLGQLALEIAGELGMETLMAVREGFREADRHPSGLSALVPLVKLFVMGAALGGLSLLIRRQRLFPSGPVPGLNVLLSPLCVGGIMHAWGRHRLARGHDVTDLATFEGGASFALGTSLVRFLWAR